MSYTLEMIQQIRDESGERIEVGPDRDGLGLIEIRHVAEDGKTGNRIMVDHEQPTLLIKALQSFVDAEIDYIDGEG